MILAFHVPPLARRQGLCDIDSLPEILVQKIQKKIKNLGSPRAVKLD